MRGIELRAAFLKELEEKPEMISQDNQLQKRLKIWHNMTVADLVLAGDLDENNLQSAAQLLDIGIDVTNTNSRTSSFSPYRSEKWFRCAVLTADVAGQLCRHMGFVTDIIPAPSIVASDDDVKRRLAALSFSLKRQHAIF